MTNITQTPRRVHISAYPGERYLYFDRVLDSLSKLPNVQISYSEKPTDGQNDLPSDTSALVILASERYFTAKNSGYNSEYIKAKERGLLVLPLLFDTGIINLLNTRCGKTQYILASGDFQSALSALNSKLSEGFPSNEHSKPCIFVSYRKKDRALLDELVLQIEKYTDSKNISIWYDSSITPGDNYAAEIDNALTNCKLFILLVSPSLLEKDNFVMRYEYPKAKQLGKKIIAVEGKKTERKALAKYFPDLPCPVNFRQFGAIEAQINKLFKVNLLQED